MKTTNVAALICDALAFYVFTTYAQKFLVNTTGFSKATASQINAATLVVFMCVQPVIGAWSDRIGRRPILMTFGALGAVGTVPLLIALETARSPLAAFTLLTGALLVVSCYTAINAVVKAELFPTEVRALGWPSPTPSPSPSSVGRPSTLPSGSREWGMSGGSIGMRRR
ncbi:MAG: MFS transporter [Gemmatimonadota bacterium]